MVAVAQKSRKQIHFFACTWLCRDDATTVYALDVGLNSVFWEFGAKLNDANEREKNFIQSLQAQYTTNGRQPPSTAHTQAITFRFQTHFDCSFDLISLPLCLRFVRNKFALLKEIEEKTTPRRIYLMKLAV